MTKFRFFSSVLLIPRRFFSTSKPKASPSPRQPFTVDYLMNRCGMPLESAISAAGKVQILETNTRKADAVLSFLKSRGFDDTHLASLISSRPRILFCRLDTTLKPKIDFLIQNGFRGELLTKLIVRNPRVLKLRLDTRLEPVFNLLQTCIPSFEERCAAITRFGSLITFQHNVALKPNIECLMREGVPPDRISKFIVYQPRAVVQSHQRFISAVDTLKKMGIGPKAPLFIHALRVMLSLTEANWNRKVEIFRSLGWSEEDVQETFRKGPTCFGSSEKRLRDLMDFYLNIAKLDLAMVIRYPNFLTFGLDTRLRRRQKVIEVLISKGLLKRDKSNAWIYPLSEGSFVTKYIIKNSEKVPELMDIYNSCPSKEIEDKKVKTKRLFDKRTC